MSDHVNTISEALVRLGVPCAPASAEFRRWCAERYPGWVYLDDFVASLPTEWWHVRQGEWDLCFLGSELSIMESAGMSLDSWLLPFGARMDGSYLVIDTSSRDGMVVGAVNIHSAMMNDDVELDPSHYRTYQMNYVDFLNHIRRFPLDRRYL